MKPFLLIERRAEGQHHLHAATSHVPPGSIATEHLHQARIPRVYKRDGHLRTAKYDREHPHVGDHDHRRHGDDAEQEARAQEAKVVSRPEAQEAKVHTAPVVSVTSTSSQTSTSPDPESALNQISQEIALLQARLMERDSARVHQESESRIEDLKSERQKYRVC